MDEAEEEAPMRAMAMPPPAPAMEAARAPSPRRRAKAKKKGARSELELEPEPSVAKESVQRSAPALPRYGELVLPSPDTGDRGRLRRAGAAEQYRDSLSGHRLSFDPIQQVRTGRTRAQAAARLPLPAGCAPVRPHRFDHAYRTDAPVDVPANATWQVVPVQIRQGSCDLRYITVPREEPVAYRVAAVSNALGAPLLPGPVEVYVDGGYVLTTQLPATGSGEVVELGMGVEPGLRVARNTHFEERRSGDRVVAMAELHHTVSIDLHNTLGRAVSVEVRERIPQPAEDAEVAVDEAAIEPPWEPYDQEERGEPVEGGRRWAVEVEPGAHSHLEATYVVRLYANHEVRGGNRREA